MQPDLARTAFTVAPVLRRRDGARITAVALHQRAGRVYLGLNTGALEEHRIGAAAAPAGGPHAAGSVPQHPVLRLQAEKHLFPRTAVSELAIVFGAARVAALSDDGQVLLTTLESFHLAPVPNARGATAIAADPSGAFPPQLAVAVRLAKTRSRVGVYDVIPGSATQSGHGALQKAQATIDAAVLQLVWVGSSLVAAIPGGYAVLRRGSASAAAAAGEANWHVTVLADHLSTHPLMGALPRERQVVLAWDAGMALVAGEDGAAAAPPLQLPLPPVALVAAGLFVVAVCDDGMHVFDRSTSCEVQSIEWAHDDAHINLAHRMPAADDPGGGRIVLATSRDVLIMEPVALEQQVRETLKRKRFDQALALIDVAAAAATRGAAGPMFGTAGASTAVGAAAAAEAEAARAAAAAAARHEGIVSPRSSDTGLPVPPPAAAPGPHWTEVALAQAGLLLLLDCDFDRAFAAFDRVSTAVFQPAQLFDLFPAYTEPWRGAAPRRAYWGLHGHQGLPPLQRIVEDWVELKRATAPHHSGPGTSFGGAAPAARLDEGPWDVDTLVAQGTAAAAAHLGRARLRAGVAATAGVDTLLLRLLADAGDTASLESLVTQSNSVDPEVGGAALRAAGRWHAVALMAGAQGDAETALGVWQSLSSGELQEAPSTSGAVTSAGGGPVAAAAVAVRSAAAALLDPARTPVESALRFLPWLLDSSPEDARRVLAARPDLPPDAVLAMLEGRTDDLRWQFLQHLVHALGTSDAARHTALGTDLSFAAKAALSDLRHAVDEAAAVAEAVAAGDASNVQVVAETSTINDGEAATPAAVLPAVVPPSFEELLRDIASRLPIVYAPNTAAASASPGDTGDGGMMRTSLDGAIGGVPISRRSTREQFGDGGGSALSSLEDPGQHYHYQYKPTAAMGSLDGTMGLPRVSAAASSQQQGAAIGSQQQQQQQQRRRRRDTHWQPRHQHFSALGGEPIPWHAAPGKGPAAGALRRSVSLQREQLSHAGSLATPAAATTAAMTAQGSALGHPGSGNGGVALVGLRVLPVGLGWAPPDDSEDEGSASGNEDDQGNDQEEMPDTDRGAAVVVAKPGGAAAAAARPLQRAAPPVATAARRLLALRCALAHHLQASLLYDAVALESALAGTPLWHERALVLSRRGDNAGALRALALLAVEVDGAIAYCRAAGGGQEAWLALLELFLRPPSGPAGDDDDDDDLGDSSATGAAGSDRASGETSAAAAAARPNYAAAVRVLNAHGARLNPLRLLQALDDDMPLALAHEALARMLGGVTHRRRTGQVVRSLSRARHLAAAADRAELRAARVVVAEDTACRGCGRLLGTRVFFRYPSGVVLCGRCVGPGGGHGGGGGGGGGSGSTEPGGAGELAPPW